MKWIFAVGMWIATMGISHFAADDKFTYGNYMISYAVFWVILIYAEILFKEK